MEKKVYVDWDKIELLIKRKGVDLEPYNGKEINYLAEKTGRPWSTIKRLKDEKSTKLETIGQIAEALGCNPIDLITAEGFDDPKFYALVAP